MSENVVQIGDFTAHRKSSRGRYRKPDDCRHYEFEMDEDGQVVRCCACKVQISAYWMLKMICDAYDRGMKDLACDRAAFKAEHEKGLRLKAAQRVEQAWRLRDHMPTCPHCRRGIGPNDGFGSSTIRKEFEQKRREQERDAKA